MNVRTALLGLFVGLTVVFASTTVYESTSRAAVTSTITATITASACPSYTTCATFVASPDGQVRVESVYANESGSAVVFWVAFENVGASPVYFSNRSLNYSVPAGSQVLKQVSCSQCLPGGSDVSWSRNLNQGEAYTLAAAFPPDKAFSYQQVRAGTVDVNLNLSWSVDVGAHTVYNSTSIFAEFDFLTP